MSISNKIRPLFPEPFWFNERNYEKSNNNDCGDLRTKNNNIDSKCNIR